MEDTQSPHLYTRLLDNLPWLPKDLTEEKETFQESLGKRVKWIDGLRGIASFLIIVTYLARAWDDDLFAPRNEEGIPPRILQWPGLRIPWQSHLGVSIFAFLTGYVCALKPIKHSRDGDRSVAFTSIAQSAFRRPSRFIFPATIALILAWVMAQFGAFTVAHRSDSLWCRQTAPNVESSLWKETVRLLATFLSTWTNGSMAYDDQQSALLPLLTASILVYLVLVATMFVRFRWRVLIYLGLFLYFHQDTVSGTEVFMMQAIYGMFLSDLSYVARFQDFIEQHRWGRKAVSAILVGSGLFIASYPEKHPEWAPWSNQMFKLAHYLFPPEALVSDRYSALGINLILFAIYISPLTKAVLSISPLLWLGKQSFAVYLLHGTLLRTVLCWMLYGIAGEPWAGEIVDQKGHPILDEAGQPLHPHWIPLRPRWVVGISIPIWIGLVYLCAWFWTSFIDPLCSRLTYKLETLMYENDESDDTDPLSPLLMGNIRMPMTS